VLDAGKLRAGLALALDRFPPFAGRVRCRRGRLSIVLREWFGSSDWICPCFISTRGAVRAESSSRSRVVVEVREHVVSAYEVTLPPYAAPRPRRPLP
jgi:hypothetical protein